MRCVQKWKHTGDTHCYTLILCLLYSGVCNFEKQCYDLAATVSTMCPDAEVTCTKGRRGREQDSKLFFFIEYIFRFSLNKFV